MFYDIDGKDSTETVVWIGGQIFDGVGLRGVMAEFLRYRDSRARQVGSPEVSIPGFPKNVERDSGAAANLIDRRVPVLGQKSARRRL